MSDPNLGTALKWSIENTGASESTEAPRTQMTYEALAAVLGGTVSPAKLMKDSMKIIESEVASLDEKLGAWMDFEDLIENLDNANNLGVLELWEPLVKQLVNPKAELRGCAAACCGSAVQNNIKSQEQLLAQGAVPTLAKMATEDTTDVRKKAILALSSLVRNFQPGLDATVENMPAEFKPQGKIDATDMESVDSLISKLRAHA